MFQAYFFFLANLAALRENIFILPFIHLDMGDVSPLTPLKDQDHYSQVNRHPGVLCHICFDLSGSWPRSHPWPCRPGIQVSHGSLQTRNGYYPHHQLRGYILCFFDTGVVIFSCIMIYGLDYYTYIKNPPLLSVQILKRLILLNIPAGFL